jgi:hypothetical protein
VLVDADPVGKTEMLKQRSLAQQVRGHGDISFDRTTASDVDFMTKTAFDTDDSSSECTASQAVYRPGSDSSSSCST